MGPGLRPRVGGRRVSKHPRDSEVGQHPSVAPPEQVAGLDIAMDDALVQQFSQPRDGVQQKASNGASSQRAAIRNMLAEGVVSTRHDQDQIPVKVEVVDDRHEVPLVVLDPRRYIYFALGEPRVGIPARRVVVADLHDLEYVLVAVNRFGVVHLRETTAGSRCRGVPGVDLAVAALDLVPVGHPSKCARPMAASPVRPEPPA